MKGWRRWSLPLWAVPVLALLYWGLGQDQRRLPSALEGREAPAFRLANLYDPSDSLSLDDLEDKVVVLNYWASWCIPCISEHPVLVQLREHYDPDEVALVGVLFQDAPENGKRFIEELGGEWPLVLDPGSRTAIEYGVYGVPETYFIGADGIVALRHDLAVTWDLVTRTVDSLLVARRAGASGAGG